MDRSGQQQLRPACFVLLQLWLIEKWTSLSTQSNYADKQPLKILTTNCFNATQKKKESKKKRKRQTKPIKPMKAIKRAVRRLKRLSQATHLNLLDCTHTHTHSRLHINVMLKGKYSTRAFVCVRVCVCLQWNCWKLQTKSRKSPFNRLQQ